MKLNYKIICIMIVMLVLASSATALVQKKDLKELTKESENIIIGKVTDQKSYWEDGKIFTDVTISVEQDVKGKSKNPVTIKVPGGTMGNMSLAVSDTPSFKNNEETVLFLRGKYFQVVGWYQGKYVVKDKKIQETGEPLDEFIGKIKQAMAVPNGNGEQKPVSDVAYAISSIAPSSGPAKAANLGSDVAASDSTQVTITGSGFGSTQGYVKFWRVGSVRNNATIISWSDTQIVARVPGGASSYYRSGSTGNVEVIRSDSTSAGTTNFLVTYSYGGGKWPSNTVNYFVNANTPDTTGELAAVQASANTWSNAGSNFQFVYGGTTTVASIDYPDGENSIFWVPDTGGSIATTWTWWYLADLNTIIECDVEFDDNNYNWDTSGSPSLSQMDVESTATHEFGHWLQLLDLYGSADSTKMMYGYGSDGEVKRNLVQQDVDGIRAIYGASVSSSITVTSPNGGNTWVRGTSNTITWSSSGTPGANVRIDLLKGGSVVGTITPSTPNDGSYSWTVSSTRALGSDYRIRVTSTSNPSITDDSNNNFLIGGINVNSPNGGNTWVRGTANTITWNSVGNPGANVKIELLKNNIPVGTVASSTPNDGSYSWTVSSTRALGSDYKIRVTSTTNAAYKDTSNSNFIIGGINVNVPNGGETWARGTSHTITWSSLGSPGPNVKIELLKGGTPVGTVVASTPNDGSQGWTVSPGRTPGTDYKIRVTSTTNIAYKDTSNSNFIIS